MANETILLIEGDTSIESNIRDVLSVNGYNYTACSSLTFIEELVSAVRVDLVIADTTVVGEDGFRLKLALNNDDKRIPIIFLTTNAPRNTLINTEVGAIAFLRKPFSIDELLTAIQKAVTYKELIRTNPESLQPIARLHIEQVGRMPIELLMSRSYTVGRYRDSDTYKADIRLNSPNASRRHGIFCRVYDANSSYYKIVDYSQNGIKVRGNKIYGYTTLQHGDDIVFPGCAMRYEVIDRSVDTNLLDTTYTSQDEAK